MSKEIEVYIKGFEFWKKDTGETLRKAYKRLESGDDDYVDIIDSIVVAMKNEYGD